MGVSRAVGLTAAAGLLCGCSLTSASVSPFASTTPAVATPAAPPPVAYGAFLEGPVGAKLSQASRDKALAAEQDALASGQRKAWKGDKGSFGYVEPAEAPSIGGAAQACRGFTSTVFLAGRPEVGHGSGCPNPDGTYRITG